MTPKYKLAIIPEWWKVVPEEPTGEQVRIGMDLHFTVNKYMDMVRAAPQLDTPPVLRWEDGLLIFFGAPIANVFEVHGVWQPILFARPHLDHPLFAEATEQEARRAAEKALGLPDGLVVEVV